MTSSNEFMESLVKEEKNQIKAFQYKLMSKWHWFLLFGILGMLLGFAYSYFSPPKFKGKSTILVQNEANALQGKDFFEDDGSIGGINIQDHIGVLKSTSLAKQVIGNLNWQTSWHQKKLFFDLDLYGHEPFLVYETGSRSNPKDIPLFVRMVSEDEYVVGTRKISSEIIPISDFEARGKFGIPFENEYFSFVLEKNQKVDIPMNVEYFFRFHDLENLALEYADKLDVSLEDLNGNIITLKLTESKAERVVDFLNELSQEYIKFCLAEKNRISENTVRFIDMQLEDVVDSLRQTGHLFSDFQSRNRSLNLDKEADMISTDLKRLEEEYSLSERKLNYYRNLNTYLKKNNQFSKVERNLQMGFDKDSGYNSILSPSVANIADPGLNNLVLKLGELYNKKEVLSYSVKQNEPNMLILEKEIRHTTKRLEENLQNLLINAENDQNSIAMRLDYMRNQLARLPKMEQKSINIKRKYDLNNDLYTFLLKKRAESEITIASNVPYSQILDRATLMSTLQVGPKFIINLIIGFLIGVSLPFIFIKIDDYFNNTIDSIFELEKETSLPLLGVIAHNKYRKDVLVSKRPRAGITESFRSLRTDMEVLLTNHTQKVISVQSVIPGEGKSFVSLNLAAILAMNDEKVLLVETDMRKPNLSKTFGLIGRSGLSNYLEEEESFENIISPTKIDNLSFIPAGPLPPNPAELLANGRFKSFMDIAKTKYNYVILDSAPVSVVTDGILSGKYSDVNLFILRHRYSRKGHINYINKLVKKGSVKNVVLLLNDFKYNGHDIGKFGYKNGYYQDNYISPKFKIN